MENIQINGQKIWGPPEGWVGLPPPHGTEVFIKNIPDDVLGEELYHLFSTVGMVYEIRLPVHWTGNCKGYAFLRFTKISEADAAIEWLNQRNIRPGWQITVERSLDNTRLFLSSVPNNKTEEDLKSDLLTVVENVKTVYVYPTLENPTIFRGYAFVEFESHRDAAIAKRILTPDTLFNLFERKCIAAWANPLPFLSKETLQNISILFMRRIPRNAKSHSIRMAVDSLIFPYSVHKVKRLNDYAFLTFKNHDIAEKAMMKIKCNPSFLGIKGVHVEWAIPRELANSLSTKSLDLKKNDKSEFDFGDSLNNCQSFVKIFKDCKNDRSQLLVKSDHNPKYCGAENTKNIPLKLALNTQGVRILQRPIPKLDFHDKATVSKPEPKQYDAYQHNLNNSNNTSAYMQERVLNKHIISNGRNSTEAQHLISEFRCPDSEDHYRDLHLKNWSQCLSLTDQYGSCATSPILTSPSTGSSTNLSWRWDETYSQLFTENGMSSEYDAKGCIAKTSDEIS